jgi:Flp pilus assembly protein TadG
MALELPVLFFTVLGGIEVGRGAMVKNVLEEAARAGCRVAVLQDANRGDVINAVNRVLRAADIKVKDVAIQPADLSNLAPFENVAVTVSVPYRDVSLFAPDIMKNSQLSGVCVMPAEIEIDEDLNFPNPQTGKKNKKKRTRAGSREKE